MYSILIVFRSRQQAIAFSVALGNIKKSVVSTPPHIIKGCSLSVKVSSAYQKRVQALLKNEGYSSFIGIFREKS